MVSFCTFYVLLKSNPPLTTFCYALLRIESSKYKNTPSWACNIDIYNIL